MMRESSETSIFPPPIKHPDFLPGLRDFPLQDCRGGHRAAPSVSVFSFSSSSRMALAISSSSTVTMSSTYFFTSGNVTAPAQRTAMPSAIVTFGWQSYRSAVFDGSLHRRQLGGLHADHANFRICLLHRAGHAADQAAAADRESPERRCQAAARAFRCPACPGPKSPLRHRRDE